MPRGANPNARDARERTPLHVVRSAERARALLSLGANPDARDCLGRSPLHDARSGEVARVLLEYGAPPNGFDLRHNTPLHLARRADVVRVLLDYGARVDLRNWYEHTPLCTARKSHNALRVLLDRGADPNARVGRDMTARPLEIYRRDHRAVRILLEHGADPHVGYPLVCGVSVRSAKRLLRAGADVRAKMEASGETYLHGETNPDVIALFVAHGADPNAVSHKGRSPMYTGPMYLGRTLSLLSHGADPRVGRPAEHKDWPTLTRACAAAGFAFSPTVFSLQRLCARTLRVAHVPLVGVPRGLVEGITEMTI